jgi:hyperosmotically inducible periplasmic protein
MTKDFIMLKTITLASALALGAVTLTGCAVVRDQQSVGSYIDDTTITTQVKARFAEDPTVSAMSINVETLKGVVQLAGFAKTNAERQQAETIAANVKGVSRVTNDIIVK